ADPTGSLSGNATYQELAGEIVEMSPQEWGGIPRGENSVEVFRSDPQAERQSCQLLFSHLIGIASDHTLSDRLGKTSQGIHQARAGVHQPGPYPDLHQMLLCLLAAVLDGPQQFRIYPSQPCQHPGIQPVVFPATFRNQL